MRRFHCVCGQEVFFDNPRCMRCERVREQGLSRTPLPGYVSAYAPAHPLEDFAECWAYFLHMMDTLETAHAHGVGSSVGLEEDFEACSTEWLRLTVVHNELHRSLG